MEATEKKHEQARVKIELEADRLINYEWNCSSREANASNILRLMGKNLDACKLKEHLIQEKTRLDKKNKYEFDRWYGKGILETMDALYDAVEKSRTNRTTYATDLLVAHAIIGAIKKSSLYRKFNWNNFEALVGEGLNDLISEFNCDFRGDIQCIHKVKKGAYVIVECARYPFDYDKQRYKTNEPKEIGFYAFIEKKEGKYSHDSTIYHSFEDAMFAAVCPQHHVAMSVLYKSSLEE